jgi:hypothetical protein
MDNKPIEQYWKFIEGIKDDPVYNRCKEFLAMFNGIILFAIDNPPKEIMDRELRCIDGSDDYRQRYFNKDTKQQSVVGTTVNKSEYYTLDTFYSIYKFETDCQNTSRDRGGSMQAIKDDEEQRIIIGYDLRKATEIEDEETKKKRDSQYEDSMKKIFKKCFDCDINIKVNKRHNMYEVVTNKMTDKYSTTPHKQARMYLDLVNDSVIKSSYVKEIPITTEGSGAPHRLYTLDIEASEGRGWPMCGTSDQLDKGLIDAIVKAVYTRIDGLIAKCANNITVNVSGSANNVIVNSSNVSAVNGAPLITREVAKTWVKENKPNEGESTVTYLNRYKQVNGDFIDGKKIDTRKMKQLVLEIHQDLRDENVAFQGEKRTSRWITLK